MFVEIKYNTSFSTNDEILATCLIMFISNVIVERDRIGYIRARKLYFQLLLNTYTQ